ncbi:MAG: hypothetical protein PHX08_04875 [Lachnospiraceae bacterium]|nr:hypothetical protein [Lachnospiraceae bacterium]
MKKSLRFEKMFGYAFCVVGAVICVAILMKSRWISGLDGDNASQTYAIFSQIAISLHNGEFPLWNPYVWGGIPQMGSPINEAFYPINWLLCMLCYDSTQAMVSYSIIPINISIHAIIYYAGLVVILKNVIGINRIEASVLSVLAVLSFSFSNFMTWNVYFDGFAWFPFIAFFAFKSFTENKKKWIVLLGIVFGIEALLSVSVVLIISVFFTVFLMIMYIVKNKSILNYVIKLMKAGAIGIIIGLPSITSTAVYLLNSTRFVPELGFLNTTEKIPIELFNVFKCEYSDIVAMLRISPIASFISINIVLITFALMGLVCTSRDEFSVWIKVGVIFSFFYCIGIIAPDVVYYIPFVSNLREPFMYGCFLNFFITILAGIGYRKYTQELLMKSKAIKLWSIVMVALIGIYNLLPHVNNDTVDNICAMLIIGISVLVASRFIKAHTKYMIGLGFVSVLAVLSTILYVKEINHGKYTETEAVEKINTVNITNYEELKKIDDLQKYDYTIAWGSEGSTLPQNGGALIGIRETIGYYNPLPKYNVQIHNNLDLYKRCQIQGIKYIFISSENTQDFLSWFEVAYPMFTHQDYNLQVYSDFGADDISEIYVYKVSDVVPGWAVTNIVSDMGTEQNYQWMNDLNTDLYAQAVVESNVITSDQLDADVGNTEVNVVNVNNNSIIYKTLSDGDFLLMTSQIYYPGWKVYINGVRKNILVSDETNCSVVVGGGENIIEFVYRPMYIYFAFIIQMVLIISLVAWNKIKMIQETDS